MTARPPAGLTQLAPPAGVLSPAPSATLSPPLSEPEQRPGEATRAPAAGRLKFFGRDGHVLLELSHGPPDGWQRRWVAVSRDTCWPPTTVAAPVDTIAAGADGRSSPAPRPPAGWASEAVFAASASGWHAALAGPDRRRRSVDGA
ncbi:uncharacterized protein LOC119094094 [Pollicipes pollicipes]|uniref:uncharacterized protein LOC119094094 n=1 Tax=Pollicipes pollicipes TaxID=41117 RepID=UPI001884C706|nr:uncharacterized protein LOC119094094 [Pollicipes pollicipes]